jgi:DNA replication protein
MSKFDGFPQRGGKATPLPAAFFSDLLPLIDDLAELKVTLFCFWALYQKEGKFRFLRPEDFINDAGLMQGLSAAAPDTDAAETLEAALRKACERGTLLCGVHNGANLYFVNTPVGRKAVEALEAGAWQPEDRSVEILPERPNIYQLYEDNIGPLTPMIADALKDAEREYPAHWVEEAMRVAVESNARNWRYIDAVLKRWQIEGKSREATQGSVQQGDGKRYTSGQFADYIEH